MTSPVVVPAPADGEPNPLIALFRQCVVRIDDRAGGFRGTGFFVAPGLVLTCGHVVHGTGGVRVCWQDRVAPAVVAGAVPPLESVTNPREYPLPDLAVLEVDSAVEWQHPCAGFDASRPVLSPPDVLYLAGYTIEHGPGPELTGVTTEFESLVAEDGHELFKLKRGQILGGFSGSPLLNMRTLRVAAITETTRDRHADLGGFAVPVTEFAMAFPDIHEAAQRYHVSNSRWEDVGEEERTLAAAREGRRARLPLKRPVVRLEPGADVPVSALLRPRHAIVGYVGRELLLADLADWCETRQTGPGPALWLVTGAGGFGKTRLAVQACLEAEARGWTAGLLRQDTEGEVTGEELRELAEWPGRLLIAIDYAETRPAMVRRLVEELAARPARPAARIILLVRRQATRRGLEDLFNQDHDEDLAAVLRRAGLSRLDDAAAAVDRVELFEHAVRDFAPPGQPIPELPRLRAAHFARPLYVLVAALLARRSPGTNVDTLSEQELLGELLDRHEASYWARWDQRHRLGLDPEDRRVCVALATLLTAVGDGEVLAVARLIPQHTCVPETRLMNIGRWLAQLYPDSADNGHIGIGPLEPDPLGEVLVGDVLSQHPGLLAAALDAASDRQLTRALTVAGRVAQTDHALLPQLRAALDERLGDILQRAVASGDRALITATRTAINIARPTVGAAEAADRFPEAMPVWMLPVAAMVAALAAEGLRAQAASDPAVKPELAHRLGDLAIRLAETGQRDEAFAVSGESVTAYRELAAAKRASYLPYLAAALNNHAALSDETGRRDEALEVSGEAVAAYQELADQNRATYLPYVATSLSNQAVMLGEAGRRDEALEVSEEALTLRRELAAANRAAWLPDLSASLGNHAVRLAEAGRRDEALEVSEEALTLRRELAAANRAAYLPGLAIALTNQATRLAEAGRRDEALEVSREAVAAHRQLADENRAAWLPDLSASLGNHAVRLAEAGRRDEALEVSKEALTLRRELAAANRAAYLPDFSASLINHATRLAEAGRRDEALEVSSEALATYRELVAANRAAWLPTLSASLHNHATRLADSGRRDEALEVSAEAVALRRELVAANRAAWLLDLAKSLNNHANRLAEAGRPDEALAMSGEAVAAYRELADENRAAVLSDLARSLSGHAVRLAMVGRADEALEVSEEAVALRRDLVAANRAAWLPDLALSLGNHAELLAEVGRPEDGARMFSNALGDHASSPLGCGHILLARGRWNLLRGNTAGAVSDLAEAVTALTDADDYLTRAEARGLLRKLRQDGPAAFDAAFAQTGRPLPMWLLYPGLPAEDLADAVIAWVRAADWDISRAYLRDHAAVLLTDLCEAAVEHLIDSNPAHRGLRVHLGLLRAARQYGIDAAFDAHLAQLSAAQQQNLLLAWMSTRTWGQSREFATAHASELLHPSAISILDQLATQNPGNPVLRMYRGLLGYAASAFDTAYDYLADAERTRSVLGQRDPALSRPAILALARLHSGRSADDPEAHYYLAVTALRAGHPDEAAAAIADCTSHSAPHERADFSRRLAQLANEHPALGHVITAMRQTLDRDSAAPRS